MPIAFNYAARSDVGMVRSNNEDSGYAGPHLLAMADGMGGHAGGDIASSTIVAALVDLDDQALSGAEATDALLACIESANADLGRQVKEDHRLDGMGTTLIALLRARDKLVLAHIGDSRAFLVREGKVAQITKDHSFVQQLVDQGRITAEEAQTHPQRSLVTKVLTGQPDDEPDVVVRQAIVGDRYLIASDGLTDYVARDTIDEVLVGTRRPADCAERLVQLALKAGAPDNVTVVIGDVVDMVKGPVPSDVPEVVGAAAVPRRRGTRPIPVTPAEKAAALTAEATGTDRRDTDTGGELDVQLAEEGPPSRRGRVLRVLGAAVVALVVLLGGAYASWLWVQTQYWVGSDGDRVVLYRGVDQRLGPIDLSRVDTKTSIRVSGLPSVYQDQLVKGVEFTSRTAALERIATLEVQARACAWAARNSETCPMVDRSWTEPTPSPSPSPSSSPSGSRSPSPSPSASPSASSTAPAA
ncbi:MAG TPA: protein phosphatase 2C domain-containing protein [Phycicoccus sp.]|nr:protein phosphatase 2C domain-containing protein [Phycicoccus sp.]HQH07599.1 protein phosphatase 2C domain-containing protein [Phycicoccus sp.]HQK31638.1 protein phosphatase 2C domain-containing protein [Phycicoccus sp.]HQY95829.1 protein phosphatase 2C domain-containing protein [Phycicoccus sp.]HRA44313.1 protein phosphatase 2C domain-containing protein [Phycicoccus sp.]